MAPLTYRCPHTGYHVQWLAEEVLGLETETYQPVNCIVCQQIHYVNPATGRVLGQSDD
jgi:hypothetical protein